MKFSKIPTATITRLSIYSRYLESLSQEGVKIIASDKLAQKC
ncbi:MAG: redox-sensing transcriptional repressor Rex, partial [Deltaproteobacteria bacterium]|nr:redox-sensing transcriptional repressor Rex [Deltaproteobacteria bacterium]